MSLLDAPQYDPARERRQKLRIGIIVIAVLIIGMLVYLNRYWLQEREVNQFFTALEHQNFKQAYGIWMADPKWEQHPQKFERYPFNEFYQDWGPGGEWGLIHAHRVEGAVRPKGGNGVVVVTEVNGRAEPSRLWVDSEDKTLSFSPF